MSRALKKAAMFLWNWFWWPDAAPARNLPDNFTVKTCPVLLTQQQVTQQLAGLRRVPPPQPRTAFEPSVLHAQLTARHAQMQAARQARATLGDSMAALNCATQ